MSFPTPEEFFAADMEKRIPSYLQRNYKDTIDSFRGGFRLGILYCKKKADYEKNLDEKAKPDSIS